MRVVLIKRMQRKCAVDARKIMTGKAKVLPLGCALFMIADPLGAFAR